MSIDSDHINYLVYRYLQEAGFQHSAFTFGQESGIVRSSVSQIKIPPGSLIAALQRSLNYVQAEVNLAESGPADPENLEAIDALTLIESVQPDKCEAKRAQLRNKLQEKAVDEDIEVPASKVTILKGHDNEVFACAWNPHCNMIASGSSDSTARIWSLDGPNGVVDALVLRHLAPHGEETKDVTTLDWKKDGSLLGTGSYDGTGRIWTKTGELHNTLTGHKGPVFSLKWNAKGNYLVTSSVDCTAIVWETATGQIFQKFSFHSAPCLDVDWRNDECFASCSQDMAIYVCQVGAVTPVKRFGAPGGTSSDGHTDEVNAIRWDSEGAYLASCSDDCSAKIWSLELDSPLHTLNHADKIYSLKWGPKADEKEERKLMLASASFDHTTKIWDALEGACMFTLEGHNLPVYSVDFSPDGVHLATGSSDKRLLVWSTKTGKLVKSYEGGGGIFEVCWDREGKRIATCYQDTTVAIIDFSV
eukprot:m.81094 g.81094  ORF g.81094 m.81094 type:complete len:474 (-) comp25384_c0_seq1:119-1540(-)